MKQLS